MEECKQARTLAVNIFMTTTNDNTKLLSQCHNYDCSLLEGYFLWTSAKPCIFYDMFMNSTTQTA